jgi:hypothetical protein
MSDSRKRKAVDQLSPYSTKDEEYIEVPEKSSSQPLRTRKRAKANIGKSTGIVSDPDALKGVLSSINILSQPDSEDKISGLNKCFLNAITRAIKKQSNKDLRNIFKQYEMYIDRIEKKSDE